MVILLAGWLIGAAGQNHHHHLSGQATNNASLVAPYYRNVSVGEAWVLPNSVHDLGARDMRCECFNPDGAYILRSSLSSASDSMLLT